MRLGRVVREYGLFSLLLLLLSLTACSPGRAFMVASQPEALMPSRALSERPVRQTFVVPEAGMDELEVVLVVPDNAPALTERPLDWRVRDQTFQTLGQG